MGYPDVVIACIEHQVSLEAFRAIEAALVKHDKNTKDYSPGGWLITITANHSDHFTSDRVNIVFCHCQANTVLQFNYSNASYLGEFTISSSSDAGCISKDKAFRFAYFPLMLVSPVRRKKQDTHTNLCGHAVMSFWIIPMPLCKALYQMLVTAVRLSGPPGGGPCHGAGASRKKASFCIFIGHHHLCILLIINGYLFLYVELSVFCSTSNAFS